MRPGLVIALLVAAGCAGHRPIPGEEGAPKAVVLSTAGQDALSAGIARALNDHGYDVLRKSTTIARSRSAAAVYSVREDPERVDRVSRLLREELGLEIEILPFQQHATGGNAVVVWLGEDAAAAK